MKNWPIIIEPSLLSGDFGRLAEEAKKLEEAGADAIHIDIMDGLFVPNLTLGPRAVAAIRRSTRLFLDVHLMIYNPFDFVETFVEAGANRITFHFEATEDVEDTLAYIRRCNVEAGLAFRPETSAEMIVPFLDKSDLILIMTVNPGFGGQAFLEDMLEKIRFVRKGCEVRHIRHQGKIYEEVKVAEKIPPFNIQVDGGINEVSAPLCIEAGANVLVSGHYLFSSPNMKQAIQGLKKGGKSS